MRTSPEGLKAVQWDEWERELSNLSQEELLRPDLADRVGPWSTDKELAAFMFPLWKTTYADRKDIPLRFLVAEVRNFFDLHAAYSVKFDEVPIGADI